MSFAARSVAYTAATSTPTISYIGIVDNITQQTTYTFTSASIGGPGLIVVTVGCESISVTSPSVSSATIDGSAATIVTNANGVNSNTGPTLAGIITRRIVSGTTATIVVTLNTDASRMRIGVWRIQNNSSDTAFTTASATSTSGGTSKSVTLTSLPIDAVGIGIQTNGTQANAISWTNATVRFDSDINALSRCSGADFTTVASGNRTVSTSYTTSAQGESMSAAAWT